LLEESYKVNYSETADETPAEREYLKCCGVIPTRLKP